MINTRSSTRRVFPWNDGLLAADNHAHQQALEGFPQRGQIRVVQHGILGDQQLHQADAVAREGSTDSAEG